MTLLFIGRATLDLGYVCPSFPEEDAKLSSTAHYSMGGGPALNAAVAARALGSDVRLATLAGAGPFAAAVRKELDGLGVELADHAPGGAEVLPVSSIVVVPENGTRTVVDQVPPAECQAPDIAALLGGVTAVLTDGHLPELALPVLREAKERGLPVIFDGGSWKDRAAEFLAMTDHAIVSERFRIPDMDGAGIIESLHALGPASIAVTRGAGAIEWSDGSGRGRIRPPQVEAIDTLGAGDIFHGAFCHYSDGGLDFRASLERAADIAALSCRFYGTREWIGQLGRSAG